MNTTLLHSPSSRAANGYPLGADGSSSRPQAGDSIAQGGPRVESRNLAVDARGTRHDMAHILVILGLALLTLLAFSFSRAHRVGLPGSMLQAPAPVSSTGPPASSHGMESVAPH